MTGPVPDAIEYNVLNVVIPLPASKDAWEYNYIDVADAPVHTGSAELFYVNVLATAPAPPAGTGIRLTLPQHQILIADWRSQQWVELFTIGGRTYSGNLGDPNTVSFTMPGDSPEAALLNEGISDVRWIRDGVPIFWGRLTAATDTVGPTGYDITCSCVCYRGLLANREIQSDGGFLKQPPGGPPVVQPKGSAPLQYDNKWFIEDVIWDLINHTQTQLGGDLGIRKGIFPHTGITVADSGHVDILEFHNSDKIWDCIKTLLAMDPSVEVNCDAVAKKFNVYYPARGQDIGVVLDYGGMVNNARRTVDVPGQFGNFTRTWFSGEGDLNIDAVFLSVPNLDTRPEGRWDQSFHAIDLTTKAGQKKLAAYNFGKSSKILPSWDLTMSPGAWDGPDMLWTGDVVTLRVDRGRLNVNEKVRVYTMNLVLDQSNVETVTVTVGLPKINPFASLTTDLRKLKQH